MSQRLSAVICDNKSSGTGQRFITYAVNACPGHGQASCASHVRTHAAASWRYRSRRKRQPTLPAHTDMTSIAFLLCRFGYYSAMIVRVTNLPAASSFSDNTMTHFRGHGFNVSAFVPELISYSKRSTYI